MAKLPICADCGICYWSEGGCGTCRHAKSRLLDLEEPTLTEVTALNVRMLKSNLDRLQIRMNKTESYNKDDAKECANLSRALSQVIKEARQLENEASKEAANLGYEQKRALLTEFFRIMPQEHQRDQIQELAQIYNGLKAKSKE